MRILTISEEPTHPAIAGNRTHLRSICHALKEQGHEVEFLHVVRYSRHPKYRWRPQRPNSNQKMAAAWGDALHVYKTTARDIGADWVAEPRHIPHRLSKLAPAGLPIVVSSLVRSGKFDAVVVNYWNLMRSVQHLAGVPRILVTHESFAVPATELGPVWKSTDQKSEERAFDVADVILAIQDSDAEEFRARTQTPVFTTYHYSQINPLPVSDTANLLFLGSGNKQNVEGLRHFLRRVFPVIRTEFPSLQLMVGGPVCDSVSGTALPEGVVLQGLVDNTADFYTQGSLCISPNLRGGGLKTKVLEALAHGRTVLGSSYSLNDLPSLGSAPLIACADAGNYVDALRARLADRNVLNREREQAINYAHAVNTHFQQIIASALTAAVSRIPRT